MFPWSVTATASIPDAFTCLIRSFSRFAPSRREYCVCRWRWTKSPDIRPAIVAFAQMAFRKSSGDSVSSTMMSRQIRYRQHLFASAPVPVPVVVDDTSSLAPAEESVEGDHWHHPKVVPVAVGVELPHGRDCLGAA